MLIRLVFFRPDIDGLLKYRIRCVEVFFRHVCVSESITLPETNSSPLKIGRAPKGNNRIPTNYIFRGKLLVSGSVSLNETFGGKCHHMELSKNRGTPKWMVKIMVPNPIFKWMIWGYHYSWKHPYCHHCAEVQVCGLGRELGAQG